MKWMGATLLALSIATFTQAEAFGEHGMLPATAISMPFHPVSIQTAKEQFANAHTGQVIAAFKVDVEQIVMMKKGESLLLENIEGKDFTLMITEKHYFKNNTTVHLRCKNRDSSCSAIMRIGSTNTVIYFQTSGEEYEAEARNGVAYFYKRFLK